MISARRALEDVVDLIPPLQKPYAWSTVRKEMDRDTFERFWQESEGMPVGVPGFLGFKSTRLGNFYRTKIDWEFDQAEVYYCIEGCCVVHWFDGKVLMGVGPVGCPCDNLADPRGEKIEDN